MRPLVPVLSLLTIAGVALWSVPVAAGLGALAAAALIVRHASKPRLGEPIRASDVERVERALALGRQEIGAEGPDRAAAPGDAVGSLHIETPFGQGEVRLSWANDLPIIEIDHPISDPAEMVFVIRRRQSPFDLAPLVENTPLPGAPRDLRLRRMPLGDGLDERFDAATSRPRLFRELLDRGLRDALMDIVDAPRFRLEDCVFSGDRVLLLIQPACDPSQEPWLREALELSSWLTVGVSRFLAAAVIPSAHG